MRLRVFVQGFGFLGTLGAFGVISASLGEWLGGGGGGRRCSYVAVSVNFPFGSRVLGLRQLGVCAAGVARL